MRPVPGTSTEIKHAVLIYAIIMIAYAMLKKVRELIAQLEKAGFVNKGGKGSHRKFIHANVPLPIIISGKLGSDARKYQEKAVVQALRKAKKNEKSK